MTLTQILSKLKSLVYSKTETDTLLGNKAASSHTHSDYVPKSGGAVMTGTFIGRDSNGTEFSFCGGTGWGQGSTITLYGKNDSNRPGWIVMRADDSTAGCEMHLKNDGTAMWGSKNLAMYEDVIPRSGGSVISAESIGKTNNTSRIIICGGTDVNNGGSITVYGKDSSTGDVTIQSNDGTNMHQLRLNSNGTATWDSKNLVMQEDTVPRSGGAVFSGTEYSRTVDNSTLNLYGGTSWTNGAQLQLFGKNWADPGAFVLYATSDANTRSMLYGKPNGTLTWNGKNLAMQEDVVPKSGGPVMTGPGLYKASLNSQFEIGGGSSWQSGATMLLAGKDYSYEGSNGRIYFHSTDGTNQKSMLLYPSGTWIWDGTAVQLVSDQRLKQQIVEIDDKLLDAWEDVLPCQFKYNDAVDQKGDTARLHTGYVVQQIDEACKSHNLDISAYGLYCHEEYPEETEEVEVEQADGTKTKERKVIREASEHYSLRYTETLVVECAFLRREVKRLSERLSKLEQPSTSEK